MCKVEYDNQGIETDIKNTNEINETIGSTIPNETFTTFSLNWDDNVGKQNQAVLKKQQLLANLINKENEDYKNKLNILNKNLNQNGNIINVDLDNLYSGIKDARANVLSKTESAAQTLKSAASHAKEFSGEISSIAGSIVNEASSLETTCDKVEKIRLKIEAAEDGFSISIEDILNNGYKSIDFDKISTSVDAAKREEYIKVSEKQQEKYWKDCELKETSEPGIYLAIKGGTPLGYVTIASTTSKPTVETKIENKEDEVKDDVIIKEKKEPIAGATVSTVSEEYKIPGEISPGTTPYTYSAKKYNLDSEEYKILCATVYAEASEYKNNVYSDAIGVTSAILNRVENPGYPDTVTKVVTAPHQFSGCSYNNKKFASAMNDLNVISQDMLDAINIALEGNRNTKGFSFNGRGTYNEFK